MSTEKDAPRTDDSEPIDSSIDTAELPTEEDTQESEQAQAFNPETGEINWDCPCLGGMAHGTCGGEFKAAFSCFVYSEEEPKGMDCVEVFKAMQECFRAHPEEYADELDEEEEEEETDGETDEETGGDTDEGASSDVDVSDN